ncbi:tRNA-intron lyase [Candidatus Pacearchaeota archaeon]|nr:tRNA-intron lyase [Candidatus Pacearchaeota archaeon]|tara:strand:+ start:10477 stop:10989 length:513 start_codon:yes stop_codon:yes gene_type:complete
MIKAILSSNKIYSTSPEAFSLFEKSRFGEKSGKRILYSPSEAIFLSEKEKISVFLNSKPLSPDELLKKLKKQDKKIETKLSVFTDLRKKGYIVKTALKFGAEFRVYNKGVKPGQDHARWILQTFSSSEKLDWQDFSAKNRVAHSTKKKLLIAIVDEESSITYYEISWLKP